MQTFIKLQNVRINVVYILHYKTRSDDNGNHSIKIKMREGGYNDDIDLDYKGEIATKRFNEDLKKLDSMLLAHG